MSGTLGEIEDFLLAQVRTHLGNRVKLIASLPGDWDDDMLRKFAAVLPAVYTSFSGGGRKEAGGMNEARIDARFPVYVCTGHPHEEHRRRGNAQAIGAYDLIQLLAPFLHGLAVPGAGSFNLVDIENLYTGSVERQALTVYALTLSLPVTFELPLPSAPELGQFQTFDVLYDVPPITPTEHARWLAGDLSAPKPDAQDTVTLPV